MAKARTHRLAEMLTGSSGCSCLATEIGYGFPQRDGRATTTVFGGSRAPFLRESCTRTGEQTGCSEPDEAFASTTFLSVLCDFFISRQVADPERWLPFPVPDEALK